MYLSQCNQYRVPLLQSVLECDAAGEKPLAATTTKDLVVGRLYAVSLEKANKPEKCFGVVVEIRQIYVNDTEILENILFLVLSKLSTDLV